MILVVIEGFGKRETVNKYLGKGYEVFASGGHIRDLPEHSFGIDIKNNFQPLYKNMPDKDKIIKELLQKAKNADGILLATDPDREGEAIAWHIAYILGLDVNSQCRIEFHEITEDAVKYALLNPRAIDINLVDAQQARRVLDRLVGYKLSPFLSRKVAPKLSAGRVQSVTLKLVVDREREIINFKPEEYWVLTATMKKKNADPNVPNDDMEFKATFNSVDGKKVKIKNAEQMQRLLENIKDKEYEVYNIKKGETYSNPNPPYITSSMQQDALNKIGFNLKKTTSVAQKLYEGVDIKGEGKSALVTYIRTDSTRVAPQAQAAAKEYIIKNFGAEYYPDKPNIYKTKKDAQDAHEAIRPVNINRTPESIKDKVETDVYKLYKLIYERFIASQMSKAKYYSVSADLETVDTDKKFQFKATGKALQFAGYMKVYKSYTEEEDKEQEKMPNLEKGDLCLALNYKDEQKFTKPPARYTEASLVKTMEEKGIGRPATYTPTITNIASRNYTEKDGKYIKPTELGFKVTDILTKYFENIMSLSFTAEMETELDEIADGKLVWQDVVKEFWTDFEQQLLVAGETAESLKSAPIETDETCEKCGSKMVIREGKFGKFLSCSNYPTCKNIAKDVKITDDNKIVKVEPVEDIETDLVCEKCGAKMLIKTGKFGKFYGCSNYPTCKNIKPLDEGNYGVCPKCGKSLVRRLNKQKRYFYGCSGYPDCDFISNKPLNENTATSETNETNKNE